MIRRPPGRFGLYAFKTEPRQIQLIDEHINDPYRVILSNVVVEMLGEQGALRAIFAFDKSLHRALRLSDGHSVRAKHCKEFSHTRPQADVGDRRVCGIRIAIGRTNYWRPR